MLAGDAGSDHGLLDLCLDVIYHSNMKAVGLSNLLHLYEDWMKGRESQPALEAPTPEP